MRIIDRVFIVATLAMVIATWLSNENQKAEVTKNSHQLAELQTLITTSVAEKEKSEAMIKKVNSELSSLKSKHKQLVDSTKGNDEKLKTLMKKSQFHEATLLVVKAKSLADKGNKESAVVNLKKAKKMIWELGEKNADFKKDLHGLMRPIDLSVANIKKEPSVFSGYAGIYKTLADVTDKYSK